MPRLLHAVVPDTIDDPRQPTGGNIYDRRILTGLAARGWTVIQHRIAVRLATGDPTTDASVDGHVASALVDLPHGSLVVLDGLVGCAASRAITDASARHRLVIIVHMSFGAASMTRAVVDAESAAVTAATTVVATSEWCRDQLRELYEVDDRRLSVVPPGVDPAAPVPGSPTGRHVICIGAVAEHKGQDVLVEALARVADARWRCTIVGPLDRDPAYTKRLMNRLETLGLSDRLRFTGPLTGPDLEQAFLEADLLVVPSRFENYGMVVGEALARGIPVIASNVGGLPEALGADEAGDPPGILVSPGNPDALRTALEGWLARPALRRTLRLRAIRRRASLRTWEAASQAMDGVLTLGPDPCRTGDQ